MCVKAGLTREEKLCENNLIVPRGHILNIQSTLWNRNFRICKVNRPEPVDSDIRSTRPFYVKGLSILGLFIIIIFFNPLKSWNQSLPPTPHPNTQTHKHIHRCWGGTGLYVAVLKIQEESQGFLGCHTVYESGCRRSLHLEMTQVKMTRVGILRLKSVRQLDNSHLI